MTSRQHSNVVPASAAKINEVVMIITTLDNDEVDAWVANHDGLVIADVPYTDAPYPEMNNGWYFFYAGKKRPGCVGRLILLPNMDWTRHVHHEMLVAKATAAGMTNKKDAEAWAKSSHPRRHYMLDKLAQIMGDNELLSIYVEYANMKNEHDQMRFMRNKGVNDGLRYDDREDLLDLIWECLTNRNQADKPKRTKARRNPNRKFQIGPNPLSEPSNPDALGLQPVMLDEQSQTMPNEIVYANAELLLPTDSEEKLNDGAETNEPYEVPDVLK